MRHIMRATIAIDDALFKEAFSLSKAKTKKELINLSLQELIRKSAWSALLECMLPGQ